MPASGFAEYARLMRALPGTANEISERIGMGDGGVRRLLRKMWWLKLVHPGGARSAGQRRPAEAVWMLGEGETAARLTLAQPLRAGLQHIAWAYMWRALEDGATRKELETLSGVTAVSVRRALRALSGMIYVAEYERDALGRPFPVYRLGRKKHVPKPTPPTAAEKWRRYQVRKQVRLLSQAQLSHAGHA